MSWFKRKEYFCRHPTCTKTFDTKEDMLKHYYPKHEGHPYNPEEERIKSLKPVIDAEIIEKEYTVYKRRIMIGESEASAKAGLKNLKFKDKNPKKKKLQFDLEKMSDNNSDDPNKDWIDGVEKPKIEKKKK